MSVLIPFILLASATSPEPWPRNLSELYAEGKVWSIHLKFTAKEWAAMEPETPKNRGFGGMPPGPSMFVAPVLLKAGDRDGDGVLSGAEFRELGESWFSQWDKASAGKLVMKQLRDGLNKAFGPPPGAGDGPPQMNLQGPKGKRNGVSAMMGIEFNYVRADLDFEGRAYPNVGVRYKGNGTFLESRATLKRSFKIDINKYVRGMELAGAKTLNVHNNVTDASLMNEALAYRLYRDAGLPAPRVAYAKVFVTVPGTHNTRYFGLYSLVESVDEKFIEKFLKSSGGAILKPVSPALFTDLGDDWDGYRQTYDPKTDLTKAQEQRVIAFCKLVSRSSDAEFAARLGDFVDLDQLARYMAVMTWLSDLDGIFGPGQNFYVYLHPITHKFLFIPWDQDHSFGQFPMRGTQDEREQLSIQKPWDGSNRFLERLYRVDAFKKSYLARMNEYSRTVFRPERFEAQVAELAAAIRPAVAEESPGKLVRFDKAIAGEPLTFQFGPPPGPPPGETKPAGAAKGANPSAPPAGPFGGGGPQWAIIPIRPFVKTRSKSVGDQLAGKSTGLTIGGSVPANRRPRQDFGPGDFLGGLFMREFDKNHDMVISHEEFTGGFAKWLATWDTDKGGRITETQLRAGIDKDLAFSFGGGPPGGPGTRRDEKKP